MIGGMQSPGSTFNGRFSFSAGGWRVDVNLPQPMGGAGGAVLEGKVYILGGGSDPALVFRWDTATSTWQSATPLTLPRTMAFTAAAPSEAGQDAIYVIGGVDVTGEVVGAVQQGVVSDGQSP